MRANRLSARLKNAIALLSRGRLGRGAADLSRWAIRPLPPRRPPETPLERRALDRLDRNGREPLLRLATELAREAYGEELRRGGWVLDIGLYGPELFLGEVLTELRRADGVLWEIVPADAIRDPAQAADASSLASRPCGGRSPLRRAG
jgi:hypothetical protein